MSLEDYDPSKHLYGKKGSAGTGFVPSAPYSESSFQKKFMKWFEQNKDKDDDVSKMFKALDNERDRIRNDVETAYSSIRAGNKNARVLITVAVDDGGDFLYLSNMNNGKFVSWLDEENKQRRRKYETLGNSSGKGVCYLCETATDMAGFALPNAGFKFSTADKGNFIYDFKASEFWKSIPVCDECAKNLESAHTYIQRYLQFPRPSERKGKSDLRSTMFWVIPNGYGRVGEMFGVFDASVRRNATGVKTGLVAVEDRLYDYASEIGQNPFTFTLLFFEKVREHMNIRAMVNDIVPSRFKKLYDMQWEVKKLPIFSEQSMKKLFYKWGQGSFFDAVVKSDPVVRGAQEGNWPVLMLQYYYSESIKVHGILKYIIHDEFYRLLDVIFLGKMLKIDIPNDLMVKIRGVERDVRRGNLPFNAVRKETLRSLALYIYLKNSRAIAGETKMTGEIEGCNVPDEMENFFRNICVENVEERAAVSTGVLVGKTLYVQRTNRNIKERGKEPFWNKLRGLDIDNERLRSLLPASIAKMREYDKYFPDIERVAACYQAKAGRMNGMSRGDISYFFTVGLVMGDTLWPSKRESKNHVEGVINE